jgi:hypothetical protein
VKGEKEEENSKSITLYAHQVHSAGGVKNDMSICMVFKLLAVKVDIVRTGSEVTPCFSRTHKEDDQFSP